MNLKMEPVRRKWGRFYFFGDTDNGQWVDPDEIVSVRGGSEDKAGQAWTWLQLRNGNEVNVPGIPGDLVRIMIGESPKYSDDNGKVLVEAIA